MVQSDFRDRTAEFFQIVEKLSGQRKECESSASASTATELNAASQISQNISQIESHIARLKRLSQSHNLFDNSGGEVTQLTSQIRSSISERESEIRLLESAPGTNGPHFQVVLEGLKHSLAAHTQAFALILTMRTRTVKQQQNRRKLYEAEPVQDGQGLRQRKGAGVYDSAEEIPKEVPSQDTLRVRSQRPAQAVEQMESTIHELGQMYGRLVELVGTQGETVIRIDQNLDQSLVHVDRGHSSLMQYYQRVSSTQGLLVKLFGVIILLSCLILIFLK